MDGSGLRVTSPSRSVISGARPSLRPKRVLFLPIPFPLFVLNQGDRWSESCECRPDLFRVPAGAAPSKVESLLLTIVLSWNITSTVPVPVVIFHPHAMQQALRPLLHCWPHPCVLVHERPVE